MRIGLIAPPWVPVPPPRYGGTEAIVDSLARGIVAAGHEVVLCTTGDATCPVPRRWVHPRPPDQIGTTIAELQHVQLAYEALADCDLIHDHTTVGPVWAATRRHRVPLVATNHGEYTPELRSLYREVAQWACLTAISHSQRATAVGVPIASIIHHGVDVAGFPVGEGTGGYALFLGRLCPEKGAHRAIRIARRAGVPLRIAAKMREPAERAYFERWVKPTLGSDVEFVGEVDTAERSRLLGDACALLNPIDWDEPFGLVMIEALACGTPVIAYARGSAPEIVDHGVTGFLCKDTTGAARALEVVSTLERSACRMSAERRFAAARMVGDYLRLYTRVATTVPLLPRVGQAASPVRLVTPDEGARFVAGV